MKKISVFFLSKPKNRILHPLIAFNIIVVFSIWLFWKLPKKHWRNSWNNIPIWTSVPTICTYVYYRKNKASMSIHLVYFDIQNTNILDDSLVTKWTKYFYLKLKYKEIASKIGKLMPQKQHNHYCQDSQLYTE